MEMNSNCLLTLRGVTMDMINSDIVSWLQSKPKVVDNAPTFIPLPKTFSGVSTWPSTSNLMCWSCGRIPKDYPRFIPTNASFDIDGKPICDPLGNFDSWHCVIRYIETELPKPQQWDLVKCTMIFAELFTGVKYDKILGAPSKVRMEQYCGSGIGCTSDDFDRQIRMLESIKKIQSA